LLQSCPACFSEPELPSSREGERNLVLKRAKSAALQHALPAQFTNLRIRMFITMPSAKNVNSTDEPP